MEPPRFPEELPDEEDDIPEPVAQGIASPVDSLHSGYGIAGGTPVQGPEPHERETPGTLVVEVTDSARVTGQEPDECPLEPCEFSMCPFCGRDFNFPKTPRFCQHSSLYCRHYVQALPQ